MTIKSKAIQLATIAVCFFFCKIQSVHAQNKLKPDSAQLKCCNPLKMPPSKEGLQCCGITGKWVSSIGDGKTYICDGVTSKTPTSEYPFGKQCPLVCTDIKRKNQCKQYDECHWLYGRKKCVSENDIDCSNIVIKANCVRFEKCQYVNNICLPADECPEPRAIKQSKCRTKDKPVKCGDCNYQSPCWARIAGFEKRDCLRVCKSDNECNRNRGEICYTGFDRTCDVDCSEQKKRFCPGVCITSSGTRCDNSLDESTCPIGERCVDRKGDNCSRNCAEPTVDCPSICVDAICPKPIKAFCPLDSRPVICDNCRYLNACFAYAAGFDNATCRLENLCPKPDAHICSAIYKPLICEDKCQYSNACVARAAGFDERQCKPDCAATKCKKIKCKSGYKVGRMPGECCDTCIKATCREPDLGQCPKALRPVVCGDDCSYNNDCLAGSAGYQPEQCRPDCSNMECPDKCAVGWKMVEKPGDCCGSCEKEASPDCSDKKCPVIKCATGSKPQKKAGECCSSECVTDDTCPPAGLVGCPKIRRPVICGEGCKYDNDCLATKGAGFKLKDCKRDLCSRTKCQQLKCSVGYKPFKKPGECCYTMCIKGP